MKGLIRAELLISKNNNYLILQYLPKTKQKKTTDKNQPIKINNILSKAVLITLKPSFIMIEYIIDNLFIVYET